MKELNKFGVVKTNYPLKRLTTFKIGGPAKAVIWVKKETLLADLICYLKKRSCPSVSYTHLTLPTNREV